MTEKFDVIICGAGPAGCTAALALGSSGLKVALIEKEQFPREKVCGDAIPAYVPKVLNSINPEYARAFEGITEKKEVDVFRIVSPDRKILDLKFPEHGYICRRSIFDMFLFDLASQLPNLTVLQDTLVKDVTVNNNQVVVNTDNSLGLKAQLVIVCDGAHSITRKKLTFIQTGKNEGSVAVRAYFKNIKDTRPETLEFHFLKELLPGYFWIFPLPENQFNVGLGMPSISFSGKKINLREEMIKIIESNPYLNYRFSAAEMISEIKGHLLPLFTRKNKISGERFMLCGDAASLVNPVSGAGIGQAMQSGRSAGWQALKCFEKNDFSEEYMRNYENSVYEKLWKENKRYILIRGYVIKYPRILNTIVKAGSASKFINRMIVKYLK